jgi:phage host-nuclease inhibitor protein Gam
MVDGITTEQELRRAVETEFSFAIDAVVDFYKNELQGIQEEVQSIRKKDREFIANKRARMRETAKVETADNNG